MSSTAALMPGHTFNSYSGPNGHYSFCECGHSLKWETREEDHALHLLGVAWCWGYAAGDIGDTYNPFRTA